MVADEHDPWHPDEGDEGLPPAGRYVPASLRMYRAMAALDGAAPRTLGACRAAALRYLESVQRDGVGPGVALRLLRAAAAARLPAHWSAAERLRFDARLHFWIGTIYGLRWSAAPGLGAPPDADA